MPTHSGSRRVCQWPKRTACVCGPDRPQYAAPPPSPPPPRPGAAHWHHLAQSAHASSASPSAAQSGATRIGSLPQTQRTQQPRKLDRLARGKASRDCAERAIRRRRLSHAARNCTATMGEYAWQLYEPWHSSCITLITWVCPARGGFGGADLQPLDLATRTPQLRSRSRALFDGPRPPARGERASALSRALGRSAPHARGSSSIRPFRFGLRLCWRLHRRFHQRRCRRLRSAADAGCGVQRYRATVALGCARHRRRCRRRLRRSSARHSGESKGFMQRGEAGR